MNDLDFQVHMAELSDADAIALAHLDSIRSIGPQFYSPRVVADWGGGLTGHLYASAIRRGETFFVALGRIHDSEAVLGFSSAHRIERTTHGVSVYVAGHVTRRGLGTALFRAAEAKTTADGARTIEIDASLGPFLYEVSAWDPLLLGLAAASLTAIAAVAGLPPAWRALRVDPAASLRQE